MTKLADKKCVPCEGGMPPLQLGKVSELSKELAFSWQVETNQFLKHTFKFESFKQAIEFVNKIAKIAENQGHHPDIEINYNKVTVTLTTHAIGGLSENDFIIASKIEAL